MVIGEEVLEQVRKLLRKRLTKLKQAQNSIRIMPDERCPPGAGEEFFSLHGFSQQLETSPGDVTKAYVCGFQIAYTRRVIGIPNELAGETIITYDERLIQKVKPAMMDRLNEIAESLNLQDGWTLINAINTVTNASTGGCFLEPFALLSFSNDPELVHEEHFDIQPENTGLARDVRYAGILYRMEFGGARYIRPSRPA